MGNWNNNVYYFVRPTIPQWNITHAKAYSLPHCVCQIWSEIPKRVSGQSCCRDRGETMRKIMIVQELCVCFD